MTSLTQFNQISNAELLSRLETLSNAFRAYANQRRDPSLTWLTTKWDAINQELGRRL